MTVHRPQLSLNLIPTSAGPKRCTSKRTNTKIHALKPVVRLLLVSGLLWFSLISAIPCRGQSSGDNAAADTRNNADKVLRSSAQVNPATLGVELTIPLGEFHGRGNAALLGALYYSSKAWRMDTGATTVASNTPGITIVTSVMPVFGEFSQAGWTNSLQPPRLEFADLRKYNQPSGGGGGPGGGGGGGDFICFESVDGWCTCSAGGAITGCFRALVNAANGTGTSETGTIGTDNGHQVIYRIVVHMPDGSTQELVKSTTPTNIPPGGTENPEGTYYATDGSNFRLEYSSSGLTPLFLPDGSHYIFNFANFAQGGQAEPPIQYIDRNGNQLSYVSSSGAAPQWQDTMGRTLASPFVNNVPTVGDFAYSVPGVNGSSRTYILRWRQLSDVRTDPTQPLQYAAENTNCDLASGTYHSPSLFTSSCDGDAFPNQLFNPVLLSEVVLPNGQSYKFTYNIYAEMDKVVYPTGGYERYRYDQVPAASGLSRLYRQGNRGVVERWVSATGGGTDEVHWQYSATRSPAGTTPLLLQVNTLAPDGTRSERSLFADQFRTDPLTLPSVLTGRPFEERAFSVTGQMLRRSLSDWTVCTRGPQLTKRVEILLDTGGNALAKTATYGYDQDLNRTSTNEYDYVSVDPTTAQTGASSTIPVGSLLRTAEATFLVNDPAIDPTTQAAYRGRNLLALPTSTRVKDVVGNIIAQSTISYDETSFPLLTYDSVTGWTDPGTNVRGNATSHATWLNTTDSYLQTHAQYDQCGNVRKLWDARDTTLINPTQIEYSSLYQYAYPTLKTSADPDKTPNSDGPLVPLTTSTVYDSGTGLATSATDANKTFSTIAYDDRLLRPKSTVHAYGNSAQTQSAMEYDDTSRTITGKSDLNNFNDSALKAKTLYDGMGRAIETRTYESDTSYIAVQTQYDAMGRAYMVSNPFRQNETPAWTTSGFDALGRVISVTTPDGAVVNTSYLGNTVTVTDQAGKKRRSVTDALGRLIRVDEPDANGNLDVNGSPFQSTDYAYDVLDNLVRVTQGDQPPRRFVYDSLKRLISATNPESGTICHGTVANGQCQGNGYDANGNLTTRTDARGVVSTYSYDALNRNTGVTYTNDPANTPAVTRTYDGATNGLGRLWKTETSGASGTRTTIDSYDALGRPQIERQQFYWNNAWSQAFPVITSYDKAGHVLSLIYPSGHSVSYNFDAAGRLADKDAQNLAFTGNLGDGATPRTYAAGISYDSANHWTREQFGTDTPIYNKRHYNVREQLYDMRASTVNDDGDGNRGNIANYYNFQNYGFGTSGTDNNGNLLIQQHWIPDGSGGYTVHQQNYDYDSLNRIRWLEEYLNGALPATGSQSFSYDRYGNRTLSGFGDGINTQQFSIDLNTNRYGVPAGQSGTMSYDAAGNLTTDTYSASAVTRVYDAENRMTSETQANNYVAGSYSYDGDGRRVKRNINNTETWQVYGLGGELIAEYAQNGPASSPQKEYGYRNGQLLVIATITSGWGSAPTINDNPLSAGQTTVQARHITELRDAINALRSHMNLSAYSWQYSATTNDFISANPILEMRTALDQALGAPTGGYSAGLAQNQFVMAIHIQELRNRVLAAWQSGSSVDVRWMVTDQLGTPRMIFDQSGSLANVSRHDYLPFGEELFAYVGGRTPQQGYTLSDNVRQKFTQKERDNETGLDYFGARYFASMQGRFTSPDAPFADQSADNPQSWNLYSYVRNHPLIMIDPTGRFGDYYWKDGTWAYTDNLRDNKVYALNETHEADGSINLTPELLRNITHTQFRIIANIVRQEAGTADAQESLWIAHTSDNEASATHSPLYDLLQTRFSSAGDKVNGIATNDSSDRANAARAGVIDVLTFGHDPTGGARRWDGTDFLAWGLNGPYGSHAKFRQYTTIDIAGDIYSTYESAQTAKWGNSVRYPGRGTYTLPAAVFTNMANWTAAGDFHYVTGARNATRGLTATGARGQTIFWRF